jgi:hypothetical protein
MIDALYISLIRTPLDDTQRNLEIRKRDQSLEDNKFENILRIINP